MGVQGFHTYLLIRNSQKNGAVGALKEEEEPSAIIPPPPTITEIQDNQQPPTHHDECGELLKNTFPSYRQLFGDGGGSSINLGCKLTIVNAGFPQSGSNLIYSLVADSMKRLRKHMGLKFSNLEYWRFARHMEGSPEEDYKKTLAELGRVANDTDVLYLKTHEYDPEVFGLCDKTLVITSTANVNELLNSAITAGWISKDCDVISNHFQSQLSHHRCWQRHARLSFDIKSDKRLAAISLLNGIADLFEVNQTKYLELIHTSDLMYYPPDFLKWEANTMIPGSNGNEDPYSSSSNCSAVEEIF